MISKERVLVVDDEADIQDGVSRWLGFAGFETLLADNGNEGIASARANAPEAILLDMQMPGKDGIQTLAVLRSDQGTTDIPVVMLSASLRDEQRALDAGARYFVHKPYDGKQLVATIQAAIQQSTPNEL